MPNPTFEIFRSMNNNQFYFRLRSGNGEPILSSEGYYSKQSCRNGISSVKYNSIIDSRYERRDGYLNFTFNLTSLNGEVIGRSENYKTKSARENGIEAVKSDAPNAPIEDLS